MPGAQTIRFPHCKAPRRVVTLVTVNLKETLYARRENHPPQIVG